MKILHVVPGLAEPANGIARMAKDIAAAQLAEIVDMREFVNLQPSTFNLQPYDEVWVHSNWMPMVWRACWRVIRASRVARRTMGDGRSGSEKRVKLVRMPHGNLDPVRYHSKYWKKALVSPIERWLYRRTDRVVVTCEAEAEWVREFLDHGRHGKYGKGVEIEVHDCKRYFDLGKGERVNGCKGERVLFLGRAEDPLKGVGYLKRAVSEIGSGIELHVVRDKFGEELEKEWAWCDVLCLPTLSENFGRVVAEALERGKKVITTDGAPAWKDWKDNLIYLEGFRAGSGRKRVELLKQALGGNI